VSSLNKVSEESNRQSRSVALHRSAVELYASPALPRQLFDRFAIILPVIEDEFRRGFSHTELHQTLIDAGMLINWNTYKVYLKRGRKATKQSPKKVPSREGEIAPQITSVPGPVRSSVKDPLRPPEFHWKPGEKLDSNW